MENFVFGPHIRLGRTTYGFVHDFAHGFGRDCFRSMVLDASTSINMYCNIGRIIMKNQSGGPIFGIQGKISVYMCYALALFIFCLLEFVRREFLYGVKTYKKCEFSPNSCIVSFMYN